MIFTHHYNLPTERTIVEKQQALLKVTNNIVMEMNSQHAVLLVLLDLSTDTVDHSVLLHRLVWFKSFLSARSQRVSIPGALSDSLPLDWGVPQGSCLGPLLYIIYSSKLFNIIERHLPNSHCYVDDSQIYLSFKPDDLSSQQNAITAMQNCTDDIRSWMEHDKLSTMKRRNFSSLATDNSYLKLIFLRSPWETLL